MELKPSSLICQSGRGRPGATRYSLSVQTDIVIFHVEGASSALDEVQISESRNIGSTGVLIPEIDGQNLTFIYDRDEFADEQTKTRWNIFGQAIGGKLKGRQLKQIRHGDYFVFAWLVFKPKTGIYSEKQESHSKFFAERE